MTETEKLAPEPIRLKRKYTHAHHGHHKATGDHQGKRHRHKIGYAKHVARFGEPPDKVMLMGPTGKTRMVLRGDLP